MAFSGAIGVLNLVPCFALDGQYILASILNINKKQTLTLGDSRSSSQQEKHPVIYVILMFFGTGLLLVNILCAFASLMYNKLGIVYNSIGQNQG